MRRVALLAGVAAALCAAQPTARAAVITVSLPQTLSATPVSFSLGNGAATFGLVLDTSGFLPGAAISTTGTGGVTTNSAAFGGGVADFGVGSPIDGTGLFTFNAYPTPASIPNSQADDFVGLSYRGTDGVHYGFAEVSGGSLVGYAFESTANTTITTATITAAAVPEPASAALLAAGFVGAIALASRPRRTNRRDMLTA